MPAPADSLDRYSRQVRFPPLGETGQRALAQSRVTLCGCGALGTVLANHLVRAGVGHIRIIDRDFIELHNLQRQILFDEQDVRDNLPKAEAAARKLRLINSTIEIEPVVTDLDHTNAVDLMSDADLVLDGLSKPPSLKTIVPDRPSHDRRYLLDSSKIRNELGWAPAIGFEDGLRDVIAWYQENRIWWEPLKAKAPVVEGQAWVKSSS